MPWTFIQLIIQVVFDVKGRQNLIAKSWKDELHTYFLVSSPTKVAKGF